MFFKDAGVVQRHFPAAEVDEAGAQLFVGGISGVRFSMQIPSSQGD